MRRQDLKGDPGRLNSFFEYDISAPAHLALETNCVCSITITFTCTCAQTITLKLTFCAEELSNPFWSVQNIIARWCVCKLFLRNSLCVQICNLTESVACSKRSDGVRGCSTGDVCMQRYRHSPLFCKLTYSHVDFHPAPRRKGGELPPTCKRDRG